MGHNHFYMFALFNAMCHTCHTEDILVQIVGYIGMGLESFGCIAIGLNLVAAHDGS